MTYLIWMLPFAYLLGSIPTAVWVGRIFHGVDVRDHGSGNAGATNVMRVLGVKTGVPVLLIDMLKGFGAVKIMLLDDTLTTGSEGGMMVSIAMGTAAVFGHVFPVFAGFRGGKGVATIAGVCFALHWPATLSALGVFVIVLLLSKYVSLGSMLAGLSFPLLVIFVYQSQQYTLWVFSLAASLLLVITHRKNIGRLMRGEENRATFLFKDKG